jgi:probable HAF family extracellular repeat protein
MRLLRRNGRSARAIPAVLLLGMVAILIAALVGMLGIPGQGFAAPQLQAATYPYVATDLGTLGGPSTVFSGVSGRTVLVQADTRTLDRDYNKSSPNRVSTDRYISHAAIWQNGRLTDLGALPGKNSSTIVGLNVHGDGVGVSENGAIDPLVGSPMVRAVVWRGGKIRMLPTLGGKESGVGWINDLGQVVGLTTNAVHDRFGLDTWSPQGTQARAFLWTQGTGMTSLGTLGGPDSGADFVNNRGQVVGDSFTNARVNPVTGIPTEHPFLWSKATGMRDLGTLGGTLAVPKALNDRGEVVGQSNIRYDAAFHAFLWKGSKMLDLGTFGGPYSAANAINQVGHVVGFAQVMAVGNCRAFLWKNGTKTNLGVVPGHSSSGTSVNARDQVVGGSCDDPVKTDDGWLWEHGAMRDLNKLVAPSSLHLNNATHIDDGGRIVATGVLPNGNQRVVLLTPAR